MKITKDTVVTITFRATDAQGKLLEDGKEPRAYARRLQQHAARH
jgi:FKBP-type peptidyl-prolyl cis-trans isomerase SlyD